METDKKDIILSQALLTNELFEYYYLDVINPTEKDQLEQYFGNIDLIKLVQYIISNVDKNITNPGQLYVI